MKIENAIKKLGKYGEVVQTGYRYQTIIKGYEISFCNGGYDNAVCFHTQREYEKSDSTTDYFPGTYWDNLTQAIRFVEGK